MLCLLQRKNIADFYYDEMDDFRIRIPAGESNC